MADSKVQERQQQQQKKSKRDDDDDEGDEAYNAARPQRQELGAKIVVGYVILLVIAIAASGAGLVPVHPLEKSSVPNSITWAVYLQKNMHIPFILSLLYYLIIFGIQEYMSGDVKPLNLRIPLAIWSLLLAVFSFVGAMRTVPTTLRIIYNRGIWHLVCGDSHLDWIDGDPAGTWTLLFILSKIPELVDTFFIVVRKKPLITLHWYHHITVMLYCWHSWATYCLNGLIFASMNLTVHAVMYFFYMLTALGYRPTKYAIFVTLGQIVQMVIGTAVTFYIGFHEWFIVPKPLSWAFSVPTFIIEPTKEDISDECYVNSGNTVLGFLMYLSYLGFFLWYFYKAYLAPKKSGSKTEKLE